MGNLIALPGGGGVSSDETTTVAAHVLSGDKYLGSDTNDEVGIGTMTRIDSIDPAKSITISSDTAYARMSNGAHIDNASSGYPEVSIPVQSKTVNPSESSQTISPDANKLLRQVIVNAISKTYVGSGITRQAAKTVTPSESAQTAVASGVYTTGAITVAAISKTYVGSGVARRSASNVSVASNGVITVTSGYYASNATKNQTTFSSQTITPSKSSQSVATNGKFGTGNITINAIPSNYYDLTSGGVVFKDGAWGPLSGSYVGMDMSKIVWPKINYGIELVSTHKNAFIGTINGSSIRGLVHNHSGSNIVYIGLMFTKTFDVSRFSKVHFKIARERAKAARCRLYAYLVTTSKKYVYVGSDDTYGNDLEVIDYIYDISSVKGHHFFSFYTSFSYASEDAVRFDYIGFE